MNRPCVIVITCARVPPPADAERRLRFVDRGVHEGPVTRSLWHSLRVPDRLAAADSYGLSLYGPRGR